MKKIILTFAIVLFTTTLANSAEKTCQGMKKLSKAFIACKANNLKKSVGNKANNLKKVVSNKSKKPKKTENDSTASLGAKKSVEKVGDGAKNLGIKIKKSGSGVFNFIKGFGPKK